MYETVLYMKEDHRQKTLSFLVYDNLEDALWN